MSRKGYQFANTDAAAMLSVHVAKSSMTVRDIAAELGVKNASTISHWANGKEPIPIEHAQPLAAVLGMNDIIFMRAALEQRYSTIHWNRYIND